MQRLARYALTLVVVAAAAGAAAVSFIDIPAPLRPIAEPTSLQSLEALDQ